MTNPLTPRCTRRKYEVRKSVVKMLSRHIQHNLIYGQDAHITRWGYCQRRGLKNPTIERLDPTWPIHLRLWRLRIIDVEEMVKPYLPHQVFKPV